MVRTWTCCGRMVAQFQGAGIKRLSDIFFSSQVIRSFFVISYAPFGCYMGMRHFFDEKVSGTMCQKRVGDMVSHGIFEPRDRYELSFYMYSTVRRKKTEQNNSLTLFVDPCENPHKNDWVRAYTVASNSLSGSSAVNAVGRYEMERSWPILFWLVKARSLAFISLGSALALPIHPSTRAGCQLRAKTFF